MYVRNFEFGVPFFGDKKKVHNLKFVKRKNDTSEVEEDGVCDVDLLITVAKHLTHRGEDLNSQLLGEAAEYLLDAVDRIKEHYKFQERYCKVNDIKNNFYQGYVLYRNGDFQKIFGDLNSFLKTIKDIAELHPDASVGSLRVDGEELPKRVFRPVIEYHDLVNFLMDNTKKVESGDAPDIVLHEQTTQTT